MTQAQRLLELAHLLPEAALAEVVDFAEFMAQKQPPKTDATFDTFFGRLKETPLFNGKDGLDTQQELRNEWR